MCEVCRQYPCHPRCPNAPEPPVVCHCDNCNEKIHEGEEMYVIGYEKFCESCIDNGRTYAELDEWEYDE